MLHELGSGHTKCIQQAVIFRFGQGLWAGMAAHYLPGHANHNRVGRDGLDHDCIGSNSAVNSDDDIPQDLRPGSNNHMIFQSGVALALVQAGAAQGDTMIESDVPANLSRLADHDTHAMVDKELRPDRGSRVDLDPCPAANELGDHPSNQVEATNPEPVGDAIPPYSVQPLIAEQHY